MLYPVCKIKNISGSAQSLHLYEFDVDEIYTIPDDKRESWSHNDDVQAAIHSEDFEIHDENGLVSSSKAEQIIHLLGYIIHTSVSSEPAFSSKITADGNKLFRRKHGFSITIPANSSYEQKFNIPYAACKINKAEVIGGVIGDSVDFKVYDTPNGDISGYPDVMLNQFGFSVYVSQGFYEDFSKYDADLIADMKIGVTYYNNTSNQVTIYVNLTLHQLVAQ